MADGAISESEWKASNIHYDSLYNSGIIQVVITISAFEKQLVMATLHSSSLLWCNHQEIIFYHLFCCGWCCCLLFTARAEFKRWKGTRCKKAATGLNLFGSERRIDWLSGRIRVAGFFSLFCGQQRGALWDIRAGPRITKGEADGDARSGERRPSSRFTIKTAPTWFYSSLTTLSPFFSPLFPLEAAAWRKEGINLPVTELITKKKRKNTG